MAKHQLRQRTAARDKLKKKYNVAQMKKVMNTVQKVMKVNKILGGKTTNQNIQHVLLMEKGGWIFE